MAKVQKLSVWARNNGYSYYGARNRFYRGDLPQAYRNETGRIMVKVDDDKPPSKFTIVTYARVSSNKQKDDLDRQSSRLREFCISHGYDISKEYKEIASGMNDDRTKLMKILLDPDIDIIVVENRDRLTRFGFNYIAKLSHKTIIVANPNKNNDDDLMQDLISVITSLCARYYGKRRSHNVVKTLKETLK